jgi:hypothetical protein
MKQKDNSKYIIAIRNQKIFETWQEQRAFLSMADLSKVFNISLPQTYRILKANCLIKSK